MEYIPKAVLFCAGMLICTKGFSQTVTINENFTDGDHTTNPAWTDSESKYIVNTSNILQLNAASEYGEAVISTPSTAAYGEWEVWLELDFNPSGSNLSRFYIVSDTPNLKGDVNGYYIQIGDTEDEISLYRQDGNKSVKLIDGPDTVVDSDPVTVRVRITRDLNGNWELLADPSGGTSYTSQGTATDKTYAMSSYLGLFSDYTSTRSTLFEYDEIKVTKVNPPLEIQAVTVIDNQTLDLSFNLNVDPSSVQSTNFDISPDIGRPASTSTSNNTVQLSFDAPIPGGEYILTVNNITDTEGNSIAPNTQFSFQLFDSYATGDIIINEFVYDYPSSINEEYIEIKNTSNKYLNLANWKIADSNSSSLLGSAPIPIKAQSFLVISADTAELFNIFGDRNYHESDFPALNNSGAEAVQLITNTNIKADSLSYSSDWGGTDVALERRSASAPPIYKENWGNSPNPNGGTPGMANEVSEDITPPSLTALHIPATKTLKLIFDERLSQPGNYSVSQNNITSITQSSADTVTLSLGSALQDAQTYTLSIADVTDIFGNTLTPKDTSFTFYNPSPVDPGDIAINEFMYAPPSGSSEYIELYNHSDKSLDLQDWTLSDNRGSLTTITDSAFIVPPDSFVVIAPDNTLEYTYSTIALVTTSSFPALNNGGDQIIIRDQQGTLLDSLEYHSGWGGDEVALERRRPNVLGTYQSNWDDAPNGFGTPGFQNKISPDNTAPLLEKVTVIDHNKIKLIFSEKVHSTSATPKSNYSLSPSTAIQLISAQDNTVILFLAQNLIDGKRYKITVSGLTDIFGNILKETTRTFDYLKIDEARPRQIVINEILYDPGDGKADFIELYNRTDQNFDLSNWVVGDYSTKTNIDRILQLKKKEYIVLTGNKNFATSRSNVVFISDFPSLNNNTRDDIFIQNAKGLTIDSLRYDPSWSEGTESQSLERKDPFSASNDASNWEPNNSDNGMSPGQKNASYEKDTYPPELMFAKAMNSGNYAIYFDEFIALTDKLSFSLNDQSLRVISYDSTNANSIILSSESKQKESKKSSPAITVKNFSDIKGNITKSSDILVSKAPQPGDLVINEIMFDPLSDPDDNLPDQNEYIELYNKKDYAVSLEGLFLHNQPDEHNKTQNIQLISTEAKWIAPNEYALIHADESAHFKNSNTATFFELDPVNRHSILQANRTSLSLSTSNDAIFIADSTGTTIDSVFYKQSWHNPNIIDTRGIALERVNPNGLSNDKANWGSSITQKGGTPYHENSIYQQNATGPQAVGINFNPNPFSPDDDGYEDKLFINYKLDHQDYLLKVRIYDRYGRMVRTLAENKQAGFEGQLIWDGRKDDRSRNRIGIYIVVFEAYDSTSGRDRTFKQTVVLARKLQ